MNEMAVTQAKTSNSKAYQHPASAGKDLSDGWQFVNFSQTRSKTDPELRRVVRVRAMRHFKKRQREQASKVSHTSAYTTLQLSQSLPIRSSDHPQDGNVDHDDPLKRSTNFHWPDEWDQLVDEASAFATSSLAACPSSSGDEQPMTLGTGKAETMIPYSTKAVARRPSVASPSMHLGSCIGDPFYSYPISDPHNDKLLYHRKRSLPAEIK